MSLFKVRDLWSTQCGVDETFDSSCLCLANIGGPSDKIIVGSHSGFLRVFQPSIGGELSGYKATDLLIETHLQHPILQVAAGKLVSGSQMVQLCVLHPRSVAVYSLVTKSGAAEHGDQNRLVLAYEHSLRRSSFCMVLGPFGGAHGRDFVCVQSLDGTLSFFEQETFAFTRFLPGFLLPGVLVFLSRTDSFITVASNYHVESYRYQILAESGGSSDQESTLGRKITPDWMYNLGETAVDIAAVAWSVANCDVVILGQRNLFCLKDNGNFRFMKRLEYKPLCFHPYFVEPDGRLMILVTTDTNTLLVYQQTSLCWSAQLEITPVIISRGQFQNISGVLVMLSETGELQCCYLGTEPSLFVAPPLELNSISYQDTEQELRELNNVIKEHTKANTATLTSTAAERELSVSVSVSSHSELSVQCRADVESAPRCRVMVELVPNIPLSNLQVSIIVEPPLAAANTSCTISSLCEKSQVATYVYLRDLRCDVSTLQVRVVTSHMTSIGGFPRVLQITAQLPLVLVASVCALVKEALFKITLNINQPPATLAQLFPEFLVDGLFTSASNAISFQCHGRKDSVVSILTAKSSQRYRLQADSLSTLSLFAFQLVERLKKHFAKIKHFVCSYTSSLPMSELFTKLDAHFNSRINSKQLQDELGLRATQYRAIQRRLLTKFKDKTPSPISHLVTLLATTHGLILETADQLEQSMQALQQASCQLTCTCQLILLLLKMMDTASSEDFSDLEAALSSSVHHSHEQGWEEVTDAALAFLLRTSLAKSHKEKQRVTNSTVEAMKDTTKFKKHISSAIDRLSKSTNILERKEGTGDFSNVSHSSHPPKVVSPIPEGLEVPTADSSTDTEITLPISSRFTERKASGVSRGRSALLHDRKAKMLASNILDPDKISTEQMGVVSSQEETEQVTSAVIKGVIESPPDIFPSTEDEDW